MMIPVVERFLAPAQVYGLRTENSPEYGILNNKFASFQTYQGTHVTVPLSDVLTFIKATHGTDQGTIWKTGMIAMMEYYVARAGGKAQWESVLKACEINNTPLPPPAPDPYAF